MDKIKLAYDVEIDIFDKSIADKIKESHRNHVEAINKLIESDKPVPKEEVFYKRGQEFVCNGSKYTLANTNYCEVMMISSDGIALFSTKTKVNDVERITEGEFKKICTSRTFTLIEDKKK